MYKLTVSVSTRPFHTSLTVTYMTFQYENNYGNIKIDPHPILVWGKAVTRIFVQGVDLPTLFLPLSSLSKDEGTD